MSSLQVWLLGKFCVRYNQHVLEGFDARKVQELFCYLLLHRDRPHPRETIANLLWNDCSTSQSKTYLRKALWQLQSSLDSQTRPSSEGMLLVEPDWVQLNATADLWLDVAMLEQAYGCVKGVSGAKLDNRYAQTMQDVVDLYKGDLLEGWYQDWCLYERERLQQLYLIMLDKLTGYCEAHQEYETGLMHGTQILRYEPARECTHRQMMRLHYLAGDRTAALRQYMRCVTTLDEELGVKPDEDTIALYEQIRANKQAGSSTPHPPADQPSPGTSAGLCEILTHLKRFHTILIDVQSQIQQDIQAVERALSERR
jgi:DNA-binding SARP family transcriptional activator